MLLSVARPAVQYFSKLFKNGKTVEKITEHEVCGLIFLTTSSKHFSLREELGEILSKMYIGLQVKSLLFLSDFNENSPPSTDFRKITKT